MNDERNGAAIIFKCPNKDCPHKHLLVIITRDCVKKLYENIENIGKFNLLLESKNRLGPETFTTCLSLMDLKSEKNFLHQKKKPTGDG